MDILFLDYFQRPLVLIVASIILFAVTCYIWFRSKTNNFTDTSILKRVYQKNSFWQSVFSLSLFFISFTSILLISGVSRDVEKQVITKDWIDIQIVLDVSYSMIAQDIKPRRIDVAKEMIDNFIWEIYSDRVGIILFSGKPFQSVPLTFDYDFLREFIQSVDVTIVQQSTKVELAGTALWDGIILASDVLLRDSPEREKVIILITDGEANKWVSPELALRLLKEQGIKTYTIWVWKWEETTIDLPVGNFIQQIQVSWVDEEILKKISSETWARYFKADSANAFRDIFEMITQLEKTPLAYEIYTSRKSYNILLYSIILLLLTVLWYLYFYKNIKI